MIYTQKTKKYNIERIIELIHDIADSGYNELDIDDYDIYLTRDMVEPIKSALKKYRLRFNGNIISW
jgi:hypothetical protein